MQRLEREVRMQPGLRLAMGGGAELPNDLSV